MSDPWYNNAISYGVDVDRFLDSNGDGIGDFGRLEAKLDYLQWLGVTLLNAVLRFIFAQRAAPEFSVGSWHLFDVGTRRVTAHRCTGPNGIAAAVHNLPCEEQTVALELTGRRGRDLFADGDGATIRDDTREVTLPSYGYRWCGIKGQRSAD